MRLANVLTVVALAAASFAALECAAAEPQASAAGAGDQKTLVDAGGYWRYFLVSRNMAYRKEDGSLDICAHYSRGTYGNVCRGVDSELPPNEWAAFDFDDSGWRLRRGPFFPTGQGHAYGPACKDKGIMSHDGTRASFGMLCARGEFEVADTAGASDLNLSATYRGGVVVYLNGQEVARGHVPDKEKKGLEALAEDYPAEVFLGANGEAIWDGASCAKNLDRVEKRIRRLEGVRIPAAALRKGKNVLAVEVHRAPYTEKGLEAIYNGGEWSTMGLIDLELKGVVTTATGKPAEGLQVYALQPTFLPSWDDKAEVLGSAPVLRVAGAKNGGFNGQLVAASRKAVTNLAVAVSDLAGPGTIPSAAVQVRYLTPDRAWDERDLAQMATLDPVVPLPLFRPIDNCRERSQRGEAVAIPGIMQGVYLTVKVPKDAKPGEYKGTVTLTADGANSVKVPVELSVADWTLPDSMEFQTELGVIQSPESVALKYDAELWSEKHWQLMDKSFEYMGQLGCDHIHILLQRRMHFGNAESMVRWIKKEGPSTGSGQGGGYTHDFSIVEKYVDMAIKHLGKIPVVCLNAWDVADGEEPPNGKIKATRGVRITVVDPNTGKTGEAEGPWFGTPESREFWKPVFDGIAKILKARGLENSMMHGVCQDSGHGYYRPPSKQAWDDLAAVAPGMKWVMQSGKGAPEQLYGKTRNEFLGCLSFGYTPNQSRFFVPDLLREKRLYGWQVLYRDACSMGCGIKNTGDPSQWKAVLERHLVSGQLGIARFGFDFFDLTPEKLTRDGGSPSDGRTISSRYPENDRGFLNISRGATRLVNAGANGLLGTVRLEMLREGAQECEARISIEKALVAPDSRVKLGEDLANRAQELLDRRQVYLAALQTSGFHARDTVSDQRQLYAMAAEVQAKLL